MDNRLPASKPREASNPSDLKDYETNKSAKPANGVTMRRERIPSSPLDAVPATRCFHERERERETTISSNKPGTAIDYFYKILRKRSEGRGKKKRKFSS